jgi:hypothetical protein
VGEKVDERKGKAPLKIAFCIQISSLPAAAVILWLSLSSLLSRHRHPMSADGEENLRCLKIPAEARRERNEKIY